MRLLRVCHTVSLLLVVPISVLAQTSTTQSSPQTPQSKDQAVDLLRKARTVAGWSIDWSTVSFRYSATLNFTPQSQAPGTVVQIDGKSSGPRKLAVRTSTPGSVVSTVVNGTEAHVVTSSGTVPDSADSLSEANALFPFLIHAMTEFDDGSFSVQYRGQVALPQGEAYLIVLTPTLKPGDYLEDGRSMRAPETRIWLSAQTLLPIQMESPRSGMSNSIAYVNVRRQFSDYQTVGNVAVPFTIREALVDGDAVQTVTINSIQFGAPIPDSEFSVQR